MRAVANRILNFVLWVISCTLASTGFVLAFRIPRGTGRSGRSLLGLDRHDWADLHSWLSYAFVALLVAHLALHWAWLWKVATRGRKIPMVLGLSLGLLLVAVPWLVPLDKQEDSGKRGKASPAQEQGQTR